MTTTDAIMDYAVRRAEPFKRQELLRALAADRKVPEASIVILLARLVTSGKLARASHGMYILPDAERIVGFKPIFDYPTNEEICRISKRVSDAFPGMDFCIWQPETLMPFAGSRPDMPMATFIDVQRECASPVYRVLEDMVPDGTTALSLSMRGNVEWVTGCRQYVVRSLIRKAPVTVAADGCRVPCMEKMLVDILGDKELQFMQGIDLQALYKNVLRRYAVSRSCLLRYATRRNRKEKVEHALRFVDSVEPVSSND